MNVCFAFSYFILFVFFLLPFFFFFNDTATTEIYTLSLHDALPILKSVSEQNKLFRDTFCLFIFYFQQKFSILRSEEHTSELQSRGHLVCRLLLEKKKKRK